MSRAEIAKRLGLSRPTLTRLTRGLVDANLLVEGGTERRSSFGRPSEMLQVAGGGRHFVGIKLTGDHLYATVTDLKARVVTSQDHPLRSADLDEVVGDIVSTVSRLRVGVPSITAIGISLAGTIRTRPRPQTVLYSSYLGWRDAPLAQLVAEATGLPTAIDNDVQALTSAEHWFGAGAGLRSMVLITIGVGIGCGVVANGELVRGAHGVPGRLGHLAVDPAGPVCERGHRGCASAFLTNAAIARSLGLGDRVDGYERALRLAQEGDTAALRVFADAGYALGVIIGTLANIVDPQKVLLTGDGLPLYRIAARKVEEGIRSAYEEDPANLDLDVQPFDFGEWARSAAVLAIQATLLDEERTGMDRAVWVTV